MSEVQLEGEMDEAQAAMRKASCQLKRRNHQSDQAIPQRPVWRGVWFEPQAAHVPGRDGRGLSVRCTE